MARRTVAAICIAAATAATTAACSVLIDTSGFTGGPDDASIGASETGNAGDGAPAGEGGVGPTSEGGVGPSSGLGATWLAYGAKSGAVSVRSWDAKARTWSDPLPGPDVGAREVRWVLARNTSQGPLLAIATADPGAVSGRLQIFERQGDGSWKEAVSTALDHTETRAFDVEVQQKSGDVMVIWGVRNSFHWQRRTSKGWGNDTYGSSGNAADFIWFEMAASPVSNDLAFLISDSDKAIGGDLWDPKAEDWPEAPELDGETSTARFKCFDVAYDKNGRPMLAWGHHGTTDGEHIVWLRDDGSGGLGSQDTELNGDAAGLLVLTPRADTAAIGMAMLEYACNPVGTGCDDFVGGVWDGAGWSHFDFIDTDSTTLYEPRPSAQPVAAGWTSTGTLVAMDHRSPDSGADALFFATEHDGDPFEGQDTTPAAPMGRRDSLVMVTDEEGALLTIVEDVGGALFGKVFLPAGGWKDGADAPGTGLAIENGVPFGVTTATP